MFTQRRLSILASLALLGLSAAGCAGSSSIPAHPQARGVAVSGAGEATAVPDIARIRMGVRAHGADVASATTEVQQRMNAVLGALEEGGVAKRDLVTRDVSIYEDHREPVPLPSEVGRPMERPSSYVATNMLEVTVRDLDALDGLLAAATKAGVNEMHGITFELEDRSAADDEAIAEAMARAEAQARRLAQLSGRELGEVVKVEISDAPMPSFAAGRMAMAEAADDAMPIEAGELTVRRTVQVHYAWKD